ncbi:MAG: hypothetical protein OEV76_10460, partial [Anaerolineae bacterium]|nr:hypothetical protein [Anaerolineae bacterium]
MLFVVPFMFLCIAPSAWGQATVIFADDFEAAFAGWTLSGTPDWYTKDPKNGTHSISLREIESIQRTVSTACYQNITVSFYLGAKSLEGTETVRALWYDGGAWNVLKAIANGDPEEDGLLHYFAYALPASAANNASFALRFEINGSNPQDFGYVDDAVVLGDLIQYTLSLAGSNGLVKVNGTPQSLPWSGSFDCGSVVNLEAVPDACYEYTSWSGDLSGSINPTGITMDANKAVTANFAILQYTLSLAGSNGLVRVNGTPQSLPWSGSFDCGSVVNLEAVPDSGWEFDGWSGDLVWGGTLLTVTMDASKSITANFGEQPTLSLTKTGSGSVKVDGTLRALPWSGQFASGSTVVLEAIPDSGWQFGGWTGDVTWAGATLTVTMDASKSITANFS